MALTTIPTTGRWDTIAGYINDNFAQSAASDENVFFMVKSNETLTLSSDSSAPSYIAALELECTCPWFSVDVANGAVKNNYGSDITMGGVMSYHASNANSSSRVLYVFSEISIDDGVTWIENVASSGRTGNISGTAASFGTKSSEVFNWPDGALLRFGFYVSASGVTFQPVSFPVKSTTVTGPAFRWRLVKLP